MTFDVYDRRGWKELGFQDRLKMTLAAVLTLSSVIIGFISFIILLEIPTSVIGISGLWLSTALAILGISSHYNNELISFKTEINKRLDTKNGEKDKEL